MSGFNKKNWIGFDNYQLEEIKKGFEEGLSEKQIQIYAKPEFTPLIMDEARKGFKNGLSVEQVSYYTNTTLSMVQIEQIRLGFEEGLSKKQVDLYALKDFSMKEDEWDTLVIFEGISEENGMHELYIPECEKQIIEIRKGFEEGLSLEQVSVYADPKYSHTQMSQARKALCRGISLHDVKANIGTNALAEMVDKANGFLAPSLNDKLDRIEQGYNFKSYQEENKII